MISRSLLAVLGAVAFTACAGIRGTGPTLAGQWAPVSAELGGKEIPVASFGGATLHLTKDTYEFAGDTGTYAVLPATRPAQMDIHGQVGPNAGRTLLTIFELAGDQLTVCYQLGPGERPAEFKSSLGPQVLLIRYRRVP